MYNKVYPLSEHEQLSLGGVGIEMLPKGFRTKLYLRGCFSVLIREAKRVIDEEELPHPGQIESMGFIRDDMDAEMAIELDSSGALRTKWVYFVGRSELGSNVQSTDISGSTLGTIEETTYYSWR